MANNVRDFTVNSLQQFYNKLNNDILPTYASMSYVESAYAYILNEIVDNEYVIAQTFNSHNDRITALENVDTPTGTLTGVNLNGNAVTVNNGIAEVNTTYPVTITNDNFVVDGTTHTVTADHYYNDIQTSINEGKTPYIIFNGGMIIPYIGIITDTQTIEFGTTVNQLSIYITIGTNTANYIASRALTSESQADWNETDNSSYAYILNKPEIPSPVTESTVTGWGFTKNTGTLTGVTFNGVDASVTNGVASIAPYHIDLNGNYLYITLNGSCVLQIITTYHGQYENCSVTHLFNVDVNGDNIFVNPICLGGSTSCFELFPFMYQNGQFYPVGIRDQRSSGGDLILTIKIYNDTEDSNATKSADITVLGGTPPLSYTVSNTIIQEHDYSWEILSSSISNIFYNTTEHILYYGESDGGNIQVFTANSIVSDGGGLTGIKFNGVDASVTNGVASITATIPDDNVFIIPVTKSGTSYTTTITRTEAREALYAHKLLFVLYNNMVMPLRAYDSEDYGDYYFYAISNSYIYTMNLVAPAGDGTLSCYYSETALPSAITESTVSGWGFTKNAGTITGITMNGASKGTSGVVDLGTVITAETQPDWNVTDTSSAAYIKNKPTIPSIAGLATETYVNNKVAGIVNSAPETLDTLNELAAALGNDPDFATTVSNQIGTKVSKTELAGLGYVTQTTLSAQGYLTSFTETDPTVPSYVKSITQANITNWNSYANVQADWNATSGDAYIKNKPTIPSIAGLVSQTTLSAQSYVTTTALNTRLNSAGYISSIPTEYITQAELSANGYLTSQTKANWNETNSSSAAYIQNKPTIPSAANDSTITIQKGGTNVDTFTTNTASNKTINIPNELPTYSSSDAGKVLSINSSGQLVWVTPVNIYTGTGEPSNSMGNDGDIYLQS